MDMGEKISHEGRAKIEAVDGYLEQAIRDDRPIEALAATKVLGEVLDARARQAAGAATAGSWSWTDVGLALGVSKQAAHAKLRADARGKLAKARVKLDRAEKEGHTKIAHRARRRRDKLEKHIELSPRAQAAREALSEKEQREHDRLSSDMQKARVNLSRAERDAGRGVDPGD